KLPWLFAIPSKLNKAPMDAKTLLVSPHSYRLRLILFRDSLSDFRCQQLVIMQEGRLRIARPNASPPLTEQYTPRAWLSVFFYDLPAPQQIMSITFSPVNGHPYEAYLNLKLIDSLLNRELVKRRPADYVTKYPDGFPMPVD
ncbi:MAG: hypothetical protein ACD_39C00864G0001, partial [uncultured bacterium]